MLVKICPACGTYNKPNEILCINCMTDISGISVVDINQIQNTQDTQNKQEESSKEDLKDKKNYILLKDKKTNEVIKVFSGDIVGRTAKGMEIFEKLSNPKVISRLHCQLIFKDNKWYIRDLDSTNNTFLNTRKLEINEEYELNSGDIINLAGVIDLEVLIE